MNLRKLSGITALLVVVSIFGAARLASAASVDFFLRIEGSKQGQFRGAGTTGERLPCSQFKFQTSEATSTSSATAREAQTGKATGNAAPRDVATGQVSGKRMHGLITIVREVDKASPMFAKAVSTGEILNSVDLEFVHNGDSPKPQIYKTLHMTNVMVTSIKPMSSGGDRPMESITFTADIANIVAKDINGNKTSMDDWSK
jgi:type VI secretion system Hcp family effector